MCDDVEFSALVDDNNSPGRPGIMIDMYIACRICRYKLYLNAQIPRPDNTLLPPIRQILPGPTPSIREDLVQP
jgi:hypothetical protein